MDNKKIMIVGIILLIIVAGIILVMLNTNNYDTIEITAHGTTIEVPGDNQTKYDGEIETAKIWNWENGILVTYNSHEDENLIKVTGLGFDTLTELIKSGDNESIDGFTCYVINADEILSFNLFDIIKVNYTGKFYCIPLSNETTHDNILICCKDKDVAVHMAESVKYKNVYPNDVAVTNTINMAENMTIDLVKNYTNNSTAMNELKSTVEEKTGINVDDAISQIEQIQQYTGKLPI